MADSPHVQIPDSSPVSRQGSDAPQRRRRPQNAGPQQRNNEGKVIDETGVTVRQKFFKFLCDFEDQEDGSKYYETQLDTLLKTNESTTIVVDWTHLRSDQKYQDLSDFIQSDYYRFEPYLRESARHFVREVRAHYATDDDGKDKEFYVSFDKFDQRYLLRELTTDKVGQLCSFSATVTRTTEVRPELVEGCFECLDCGNLNKNITQQFKYTEPQICSDAQCSNRKKWNLDVERSKFVDWQKCRSQENSSDIPPGSMPRSIDVILRNECVEKTKPGDKAHFIGTLIVVPDVAQYYSKAPKIVRSMAPSGPAEGVSGIKAIGIRELNYRMVFLANHVSQQHTQQGYADIRADDMDAEDIVASFSAAERNDILAMQDTPKLYERLANSIAPNIYGHEEIKRGILLMLFGGVVKKTIEKTKLRGDINICIIGDPSTAKSQFLTFVTKILPRTVYTSGKASTSAGLTAAVMKDPETGEFGIEAGALMLADNGICCIDEFDKMDQIDQAAIHEAMEQQTITITKAGIQATLNARASILAACNPVWGRYDTSKPMQYNINLSAPIMSRFDLFFVVLDECDEVTDYHVAKHIMQVHRTGKGAEDDTINKFSIEQIQRYIRYARSINPKITEESKIWMVRFYKQLRQRDQSEQKAYRFTVRQLESLIRLSEALARLHLEHNVLPKYVKEAARLLKKSIISVDAADITLDEPDEPMEMGHGDGEEKKYDGGEKKEGGEDGKDGGGAVTGDAGAGDVEQQKVTINYNIYKRSANMIVHFIRRNEEKPEAGLKQAEIINLVIKERESEIESAEQLESENQILKFIIHRLIEIDHIILIKQDHDDDVMERVLMVHPNYDPDSKNAGNLDGRKRKK